jgi:hypothetical protein
MQKPDISDWSKVGCGRLPDYFSDFVFDSPYCVLNLINLLKLNITS